MMSFIVALIWKVFSAALLIDSSKECQVYLILSSATIRQYSAGEFNKRMQIMERRFKSVYMTFALLGLLSGTACNDYLFTGIERGELSWERIYSSDDKFYYSMTVSPTGILYVGTNKEILRYDENGDSMIVVREDSHSGRVLSLATSKNGTIYASTLSGGMIRSSDGGQNWVEINAELEYATVYDIDFNSADEIFIATNIGVFTSSNDGDDWTPLTIDSTLSFVRTLAVGHDGIVFAADAFLGGVYRSTDNGASWSKVIDFRASKIAVNSEGDTFVGVGPRSPSDLIRSTDDGITWTGISPFASNHSVRAIVFDSQDDVYLMNNRGIFRSFDNGETWIAANDGLPSTFIRTMVVSENDVFYCGVNFDGIVRGTFARQ